jgi:hypothetical protein
MKNIIGMLLAIITGISLGFYGVYASVFTDAGTHERLNTISIILLIYIILSTLWGYLLTGYSWEWGFLLSLPGALFLVSYMLHDFNPYYLLYLILIIAFSSISSYVGTIFRSRKK